MATIRLPNLTFTKVSCYLLTTRNMSDQSRCDFTLPPALHLVAPGPRVLLWMVVVAQNSESNHSRALDLCNELGTPCHGASNSMKA